jgi:hypothetical protein
MEFLDISSLGAAYRYVVKIKQKFKQRNKWEFGAANASQHKHGKGDPNTLNKGQSKDGQPQDNLCKFHKIPWHNTDECRSKQSLVVELKTSKSDPGFDSVSEPYKGKWIIDAESSAVVATTKIQRNEPEEPEECERLFHSQMWLKGAPLHFIVDR